MIISKTALLILFALFLSYILLASVSGAEAQLIIPCKTPAGCKSVRCSSGSAQCVNRQCECPSLKPFNPMTVYTPKSCKTILDCAPSRQCPKNVYACIKEKCICLY
ncbi:unnamed protein product [Thlaspi arvense]|uniref:Uncharacterized protein n=1 Tax=Thlaspi arvense TaxID=13288 RepID=A0AAU9RGV1_THLAR|nr:unnamed protein product [Thlaspi arvense]